MKKVQELNSYLVIKRRGLFLLLQRKNGIWEFPGGGVEFGENPRHAAVREAAEETGLSAKAPRLIGFTSATFKAGGRNKHAVYAVYLSSKTTGKLKLSREHKAARWCTLSEARRMRLGLNVKPVLRML